MTQKHLNLTQQLLRQVKQRNKLRDKHTAKFIQVLIEKGYYDFEIEEIDEYCIVHLPFLDASYFDEVNIRYDGIIHYLTRHSLQYEGTTKSTKRIIWEDIIQSTTIRKTTEKKIKSKTIMQERIDAGEHLLDPEYNADLTDVGYTD